MSGWHANKPFGAAGSLRVLLILSLLKLQIIYQLREVWFFTASYSFSLIPSFQVNSFLYLSFILSLLNVNFAFLHRYTIPLFCISELLQPVYFANYVINLKLYTAIKTVYFCLWLLKHLLKVESGYFIVPVEHNVWHLKEYLFCAICMLIHMQCSLQEFRKTNCYSVQTTCCCSSLKT